MDVNEPNDDLSNSGIASLNKLSMIQNIDQNNLDKSNVDEMSISGHERHTSEVKNHVVKSNKKRLSNHEQNNQHNRQCFRQCSENKWKTSSSSSEIKSTKIDFGANEAKRCDEPIITELDHTASALKHNKYGEKSDEMHAKKQQISFKSERIDRNTIGAWLSAIAVITFDLEVGPSPEVVWPPDSFSDVDLQTLCGLAFPDSASNVRDDVSFCFRLRLRDSVSSLSSLQSNISVSETDDCQLPGILGYCFFRQKHDNNLPRGWFQKCFVLLSTHPFLELFTRCASIVGSAYFDLCDFSILENFIVSVSSWPKPDPGSNVILPLFSSPFAEQYIRSCLPVYLTKSRSPHVSHYMRTLPQMLLNPSSFLTQIELGTKNTVEHSAPFDSQHSSPLIISSSPLLLNVNAAEKLSPFKFKSLNDQSTEENYHSVCVATTTPTLSDDDVPDTLLTSLEWDNTKSKPQHKLHEPQSLRTCWPNEFSVAEIARLRALHGSFQTMNLFKTFRSCLSNIWFAWELAICGDPMLVIGADPSHCSDMVLSIISLISPLTYHGDYRPYFSIYDPDSKHFQELLIKSPSLLPSVIIGVTNPLFLKIYAAFPHIFFTCNEASDDISKCYRLTKSIDSVEAALRGDCVGASTIVTNHVPILVPNCSILKRLLPCRKTEPARQNLQSCLDNDDEAISLINNSVLRNHFRALTDAFLEPLLPYCTLTHQQLDEFRMDHTWCPYLKSQCPRLPKLDKEVFINSILRWPSWRLSAFSLPSGIGMKSRRRIAMQSLYRRFLQSPHFPHWFFSKKAQTEHILTSLISDAIKRLAIDNASLFLRFLDGTRLEVAIEMYKQTHVYLERALLAVDDNGTVDRALVLALQLHSRCIKNALPVQNILSHLESSWDARFSVMAHQYSSRFSSDTLDFLVNEAGLRHFVKRF